MFSTWICIYISFILFILLVWRCLSLVFLSYKVNVVCKHWCDYFSPVCVTASSLTEQQSAGCPTERSSLPTEHWSALFWAPPLCKDRWVSCWAGLYKAGHACSFSAHFTQVRIERLRNSLLPLHRNPTLGHLSESEMATFVSVSFPSLQHSGLSTAWLTLADLLVCFDPFDSCATLEGLCQKWDLSFYRLQVELQKSH